MLNFRIAQTADAFPNVTKVAEDLDRSEIDRWINRNDFKTFEFAKAVAASANSLGLYDGGRLIAGDYGPSCLPRYDVKRLPTVGDDASYSFNGDTYPDGKIVSISKSLKVVRTSTGSAYYRRRETGSWIKDGTWSLVRGTYSVRNPHL